MKLGYLFFVASDVGRQFKVCACLQAALDCYLGVQFWRWGDGDVSGFDGGERGEIISEEVVKARELGALGAF
jgi:hypothetical protein